MNVRKLVVALGLVAAGAGMLAAAPGVVGRGGVPTAEERREAMDRAVGELRAAFPETADLYVISKGSDQPALAGVKFVSWADVAGTQFYVVQASDGSRVYVNPKEILAVRLAR